MSKLAEASPATYEEYLKIEEASPVRLEYIDGRVYTRATGSFNHTTLVCTVSVVLHKLLRNHSCSAHSSMQKIGIESTGDALYPDAVVFCPPWRFTGEGDHTLLTPKLIVEVLSPETADWDQSGKFQLYQTIDTFTDYSAS